MNAFCTYCSASKSHEPGDLPAVERYLSTRITRVHQAASLLGLDFYILSGEFGLIPPSKPIPYYDHLLKPEEVRGLAVVAAEQLDEYGVGGLVYFTEPLASSRTLIPYHDLVVAACDKASIPLVEIELEEKPVSTWMGIMQAADAAKIKMVSDRQAGEADFDILLAQHPQDGMIYFKRGEAYEVLGLYDRAAADFRYALVRFPRADWQARATEALARVTRASVSATPAA
jgi:tetratricopeptide (TPR) repeat protein